MMKIKIQKMMKKILAIAATLFICLSVSAEEIQSTVKSLDGELWYGAYTAQAFNGTALDKIVLQPFPAEYGVKDLRYDNNSNQAAPLLISNMGRYIWSDAPFAFSLSGGDLHFISELEAIEAKTAGTTLREAYLAAMKQFFPPAGRTPAEELFLMPQYNTWIELGHDQSQDKILKYARAAIRNGFPTGVFMIDDQWTISYGALDFNRQFFPDPKAMVDELHELGFKVMVWVSPFISPDTPEFRTLADMDALVCLKDNGKPAILRWWNGYSACLNLEKQCALDWFEGRLKWLQDTYGIDGFKLDAADFDFYTSKSDVFPNPDTDANPNEQCRIYTDIGTRFTYSEMRASWKGGNKPVSQRLQDKGASWDDLQLIVPDMVSAGLIGLPFTCPDMIGGGLLSTFKNIDPATFDQEFFIRSAQAQIMMPMMQFSAAPWRVLDAEHTDICRKAALMHTAMGDEILAMARQAATDGEPIVRHMEYAFPHQGFERCLDQYMFGDKYLVAPILNKGGQRQVKLPKGKWVDDQGKIYNGGRTYTIQATLDRLPYFVRKK